MYGGYYHTPFLGGYGMILLWIVVVIGVVWLIRALIGPGRDRSHHDSPHLDSRHESSLEILKRRYAAGEISRDESERKKHDILSP